MDERMKELLKFRNFVGVGLFLMVCTLSTFYITLDVLQFPLYPTYITVYILSVFFSYWLNSRFTFGKKQNVKDGVKYYIVYILGLLIGIALLALFKSLFSVSNFILILMILVPRTALTYLLSRFLIFKDEEPTSTAELDVSSTE